MTIVVTGGSGFIGTQLSKKLLLLGYTVVVIDVKPPRFTHKELFFIKCDITKEALPYNILDKTDAVIHLAGTSIFGKWTKECKEEIKQSRVLGTQHVVESIKEATSRPSVFISASAVGFYGDTGNDMKDEHAEQGKGFLADVVTAWEAEAKKAEEFGVRVVCVRTAPVLGEEGFLKELTRPAKFGFLLKLSKKDFLMSWIHVDDIVNTYLFALQTNTLQDAVNAVAPEILPQETFMKTLGTVIRRRVIGSMPNWLLNMVLGEGKDELSYNQNVSSKRLVDKGFIFQYPTLEAALKEIYKK